MRTIVSVSHFKYIKDKNNTLYNKCWILEIKKNPPSRSAKLRCLIKKENFYDFKTDILDKFKDLIEIENLGLNL